MEKFRYLQQIYEDVENPCSYSGVSKLFNYVRRNGRSDITRADIKTFLKKQLAWTYHGHVPRRFVRRPIKVSRPGLILGMDLADMTENIAKHNDGYRYILIMIDCFSRKVSLVPLKNKTSLKIANALQHYLENSQYKFVFVYSDEGQEFLGSHTQKVYDKFNLTRYSVKNRKFKCAIAERVIRSLKERIYKYFTQNNTLKYIDVLKKIEKAYNNNPHRGLANETPNTVHNMTDLNDIKKQERIQLKQKCKNYGSISTCEKKNLISNPCDFEEGGYARLLLTDAERIFGKSYEKLYTEEIFVIRRIERTLPVTIWLGDLKGNPIDGAVYVRELKSVSLPDKFIVEHIIKSETDKKTGKKRYLVKWRGFPDHFNSYVDKIYKVK